MCVRFFFCIRVCCPYKFVRLYFFLCSRFFVYLSQSACMFVSLSESNVESSFMQRKIYSEKKYIYHKSKQLNKKNLY